MCKIRDFISWENNREEDETKQKKIKSLKPE